jgi:cytochrome c556
MLLARLVLAIALCASAATWAEQQSAVVPIASVKQLHEAFITPASDTLFQAESVAPPNAAAWHTLHNAALMLAEAANLLMVDGRAKDRGQWMAFARDMRNAAEAELKAVAASNLDDLVTANGQLTDACMACHEPYRDGNRGMLSQKN